MVNYNHLAYGVKSSFRKTLLIPEHGYSIGFHTMHQEDKSKVVYDKLNSISYVEAAIYCMGNTDEILIKSCVKRFLGLLNIVIRAIRCNPLLIEFLVCLRTPKLSLLESYPLFSSLASALTFFIIK